MGTRRISATAPRNWQSVDLMMFECFRWVRVDLMMFECFRWVRVERVRVRVVCGWLGLGFETLPRHGSPATLQCLYRLQ